FFRLNDRPAAPQGEFGLGSPPLAIPPDTQAQFPVEERKEAVITAAAGGQIAMEDGAIFSVPAGGFPQDAKVIIRKLDLREFTGAFARSVYDVDTGGIHLQKNASLLLPAPAGNPRLDSLHVYRHNPESGAVELEATIDTTLGMIRAETDGFSDIVVEEEAQAAKRWSDVKNDPFAYKLIDVPYYPQGFTMWCYAAASQMLAKFSGADIEAWDVGKHFGVRLDQGPKPTALYSGNYAALFAQEKIPVLENGTWIHPPNFYAYLIAQLDAGHPVMTLVQYGAHAVVVVGYDSTGVFVHDPSGHSIQTAGLPVDFTNLGAFHLTWDQWRKALFAQNLLGRLVQLPLPFWTLVLQPIPAPPAPAQTISLFSAVPLGGNNYSTPFFEAVRTVGNRNVKGQFIWDGTTAKGYRFASDPEFGPENLANSDKLALSVHAHNLSGSTVTLAVRALLDNTKVFENTSVALAPKATTKEVPIFPDAKPYDLRTGVAGLLAPGWHNLRIELFSGADVLDSIPIDLLIGPAKPEKFRFIEVPEGMRLTWFPNPEEVFSKIEYIISVNGVPVGITAEKQFLHPNGTAANVYTVTARDTVNGLESPASEPAVKLEGIPLYRDADPVITGDVGEFSSITPTSGKIVGSNPKTDAGSTVTVTWPEPPPILSSSDNFSFTVLPRIFGWPAGGDTYTITGAPRLTYSDGDTRFGNGGYILITEGHRVQNIGVSTLYGSSTSGSGVLTNFRINLSKDFFFNAGEAVISWGYKAAP
ncbi:MAG: hypothetical protein JWM99_627, partial [Verrucomicrobiales bacterium]|nr:hypothetical protein [Verrucomicrobiales bacterium]